MQCASSTAKIDSSTCSRSRRKRSLAKRSGATYSSFSVAGEEPILHVARLGEPERRVEPCRRDAAGGQLVDLILHERDQRRHDETGALEDDRGQLVAQALAAAGREHGERGAPGEQGLDDPALPGPVVGEAEYLAKGLVGAWLQLGDRHGATVAVLRARDGACVCRKRELLRTRERLADQVVVASSPGVSASPGGPRSVQSTSTGAIPSARAPSSPVVGSLDQSERWIATGCARPLA